jgi:hypothetical protein
MKGKSKVKGKSQKLKVIQREPSERLLDYGSRIIKVVAAMPGTLVGKKSWRSIITVWNLR